MSLIEAEEEVIDLCVEGMDEPSSDDAGERRNVLAMTAEKRR